MKINEYIKRQFKNYTSNVVIPLLEQTDLSVTSSSGVNDIISALQDACVSDYNTVQIPSGVYDFQGQDILLSKHLSLKGAGADRTIFKNVSFEIPYGISVDGICFDNAPHVELMTASGYKYTERTANFHTCNPDKTLEVSYSNCIFENSDYGSHICSLTTTIISDSATNCIFRNQKCSGIFHSVNSQRSRYINNVFRNMGDPTAVQGKVSGIWIGDLTNLSKVQSEDCVISDNVFEDLWTADDSTLTSHIINANFIACKADTAVITNNHIKNVHGYGQDRECLYTKVRNLTVRHNIIENGGFGEGYICCKSQPDKADSYNIIEDNIIIGDYGVGISLYGGGLIQRNTIILNKGRGGILHFGGAENGKTTTISNNYLRIEPDYYYLNGEKASNYSPTNLMGIYPMSNPVVIENNTLVSQNIDGIITYGIECPSTQYDVIVKKNNIQLMNGAYGLSIRCNNTQLPYNDTSIITVEDNLLGGTDFGLYLQFRYPEAENSKHRELHVKRNIPIVSNKRFYISSNGMNDTLEYIIADSAPIRTYTDIKNASGSTSYIYGNE